MVFPGSLHWSPPTPTKLTLSFSLSSSFCPNTSQHWALAHTLSRVKLVQNLSPGPCLPLLSPGSLPGPQPSLPPSSAELLGGRGHLDPLASRDSQQRKGRSVLLPAAPGTAWPSNSPPSLFKEKWVLPSFSLSPLGVLKERRKTATNEQPGLLRLSGVRRVSHTRPPPRHPSSHSRFLLQMCVTNNGNKTKAFCSDLNVSIRASASPQR